VVDFTEDDVRVAKLAKGLLDEDGRPDLDVSPEQLVRWRKVADAIPVAGPRRGGRNQRVQYLPTAPAAAAALAIALDADRNLDRAVLAAFGSGAPVADKGVRTAAVHHLRAVENTASKAYKKQGLTRSETPRRYRLPIPGSRLGGSSLVSDAVFALALGEKPQALSDGPGLALEALAPEADSALERDNRRRLEFIMRRLSLAALRQVAHRVDIDLWREASEWTGRVIVYGEVLSEFVALTGTEASTVPAPLSLLVPLINDLNRRTVDRSYAPGFRTAILGLVAAALIRTRRRTRLAKEMATACAAETPKLRAMARLSRELPERWRPALALGSGAAFLAQLPTQEREEAMARTRQWLDEHAIESRVLLVEGSGADATPDVT
jgi:hypothetical protein